jgi:hypothetical protein
MAEQLYKITLSGDETPVSGCESITIEQVYEFLAENQEIYEEENASGDLVKYIIVPLEG